MVLFKILKKLKQKEKEIRILILGLDNAGKTTIVKKLLGEDVNEVSPTYGFNIHTLEYNNYVLNIWDVGGQKSIRSFWRNYFESTDVIVWVIDSADKFRLNDCKKELDNLLQEERLAGASLLIFANKQDLQGAISCESISKFLCLDEISKTHHCCILSSSALNGDNLIKGIDWLVEDVSSRIFFNF